jgi:hypothetical protein
MTRAVTGDDRPKQFCALVGSEALLTETRRRAALVAPAHRTLVVVPGPGASTPLSPACALALAAQPVRAPRPRSCTRCSCSPGDERRAIR